MKWFLLVCCSVFFSMFAFASDRPSILFVMADDLGWSDLAIQGNPLIATPHLDRFAKAGLRFTDAYAAAPTCSPTRAAMMTGQAPARLRITNHMPDSERFTPKNATLASAECKTELALEYTTVAERLQDAGYHTGFFGKWHLSPRRKGKEAFEPQHQGFDINVGGTEWGGPPSFFDPYKNPNLPDRKAGEYLPDRLVDETVAFMRGVAPEDPVFACLWYYTPHYPFQAPEQYLEKYRDHKGPGANNAAYAAMIEAMDASFGKLLAGLEACGRADNTLVVFTSDNGGFAGGSDNRPLRAAKGHLYEGGIRVPLFVRWPGVTKPGLCAEPVITMDWKPTMLAAAGLEPTKDQAVDGIDLRPLLAGKPMAKRPIFWHAPNYAWHRANRLGSAVREGQWKLIERFDTGQFELFDVVADRSEKRDLAAERPKVARRLAGVLRDWREEVDAAMPTPVAVPGK